MLARSADSLCLDDVFVELAGYVVGSQVALKIEGFNAAGSIKLKTALGLIADAERRRGLKRGGRVVESSSGNLGVALGIVCAVRGYRFTCVTDPNASSSHLAIMHRLGVQVVVVDRRDEQGGYLGQRLKYIEERLREDPELIWTNQYANTANSNAHYELTAAAILREFKRVDFSVRRRRHHRNADGLCPPLSGKFPLNRHCRRRRRRLCHLWVRPRPAPDSGPGHQPASTAVSIPPASTRSC
jgi:hypothetical protein